MSQSFRVMVFAYQEQYQQAINFKVTKIDPRTKTILVYLIKIYAQPQNFFFVL